MIFSDLCVCVLWFVTDEFRLVSFSSSALTAKKGNIVRTETALDSLFADAAKLAKKVEHILQTSATHFGKLQII